MVSGCKPASAGMRVNVGVTITDVVIVKTHVPVPLQPAPLQPAKVEVGLAVAVSVIAVPDLKVVVQVAPQLIPTGLEVTVPVPVPPGITVRA